MKNNTGEKLESPKDMFLYKQERIKKYVDEKDINIRISWAINNAVQLVSSSLDGSRNSPKDYEEQIKGWTEWFLDYFKEKKQEVLDEEIKKVEKKSEQEDEAEMQIGLQLELEDEEDRSKKLKEANEAFGLK